MENTKILVVEDEIIIAKDIQWRLKEMGFDMPTVVTTGEDAVHQANELHPDLVLMDIMLPGKLDGIEAARQIRSKADIPVIYLTAYSDDSIVERAKITDPFGYIIKPVGNRELKRTIDITLHKHRAERKLREDRNWLSTVLSSIGDAVITTDTSGDVVFMNAVAEGLTGWKNADALGKPLEHVFNIVYEDTGAGAQSPVERAISNGTAVKPARPLLLISRDGVQIPIEETSAPLKDGKEAVTGTVISFSDITDRRNAEESMVRSHQSLISVLDGIDAIVYVADMDTYEILYINEYARKIFGNVEGKICWQYLQSGQSGPCGFCTNDRLLNHKGLPNSAYYWEFQNTINHRWYDIRDRAIAWLDGRIVRLEIATDITERKEAEEMLRSMSFIDDLTGLYNRRGFSTLAKQHIKAASREKKGLTLIFADLDNMKWINDKAGHPAGDIALKEIAGVLRSTFRESDTIARIGGDEFVILSMESPGINSSYMTGRLLSALETYNKQNDSPFSLSLSMGVVAYDPEHPRTINDLLREADRLMYEDKRSKKIVEERNVI